MIRFILGLLSFLVASGISVDAARAITPDKAEFRKLADGVYAYIGKRNDANAMVVVTSQGVVVVDTGNNQPESRNLMRSIQAVTAQPIRYVVITQNHGDHIGGTSLFSPPAHVIVHDKVAAALAAMKPYQIRSWRKRFSERAEALKDVNPIDTVISFPDRMKLNLGGKVIELIYIDDTYNIGDVAVWLPQDGILHAAFAGYKERHPDLRPDYSHGTTWGMVKQLEAMIALQPKVVVPAHGPLGDVTDLTAMEDYLLLARQKVRGMMDQGMPLAEIEKKFDMHEYKDWDRDEHLAWTADTIYREVKGEGPAKSAMAEKSVKGAIAKATEEGRRLTLTLEGGKELRLRITSETDIEGVADRTQLKSGQKVSALYAEPQDGSAPLGYDVLELTVEP
jgi:cyclase